jgi:subtilisin-like proprotein convertase family protein
MHIILGLHAVGDDCNTNGSPDECDITDDCNTDGVPDECEFDCNTNNINDACETDCNTNGLADVCDIGSGTSTDLDADGVPDDCQDCNANGVPDSLDISGVTSEDCNSNNVPDECDLDCNANGVADECDIAGDTSDDCNSNGIPDECDVGLFAGLQLNFEAEIPDGGSGFFLVAPINLAAGTGPIADVDIGVDIEHTWDSDLDLTAVHETTVVLLATAVGGSGDNFTGTVFDDEAATSITAGVAPFTGDFQPDPDLLSAFDGQSPSGFWALAVEDFVADDTGTLHSWTLFLTIGGGSDDLNTNGIPDECEEVDCATCPGDMNGDGLIDGDDIQCFVECKINGSTTTCTSCDCADPLTVGDFFDILLTGPNACP